MKNNRINQRIIIALFIAISFSLFIPQTVFCQAEKLGIVSYTPPGGFTKTPKENVVAFSEFNQTTGKFCIITLYGATPGTGTPSDEFTKEWNNLVVKPLKAEANPKTKTQTAEGWTIVEGGAETESEVGKAAAFLTVINGFGKTVSILAVFNDPAYVKQVDAFIGGLDLDKTAIAPTNDITAVAPATLDSDGNLVIPEPTRQLTIDDLVGEWGDNPGRISTIYVNRSDGSYAGKDSLHFTSKWKIDSNGGYTNDFFEVRNGKKLRDITTGSITINGRLISIKHKSTAYYVVRGWLELPDITVLKVAGPWYDTKDIPERVFTDFSEESRFILTAKWVRKK